MEQTHHLGLTIDPVGAQEMRGFAKWAKFLSIIGFILCGLIILFGIFFGSIMGALSGMGGGENPYGEMGPGAGAIGGIAAVLYIIIAVIYFFPTLYLFQSASKVRLALDTNDQEALNTGFMKLKACFRFIGILTIILLCFYALAIIVALLGAASIR